MRNKHYIIPVFVPELACPHQCVFCNQKKITGKNLSPDIDTVDKIIKKYFSTIKAAKENIEIGFFGGNFTGIDITAQEAYLKIAKKYIDGGLVNSIRVSTRPDYIDNEKLDLLKKYNVGTIELGAQSMDDEVLNRSGRGHKAFDTINAAKLIKSYGFSLGLQMMIGLPGDTFQKSISTAEIIIELGADCTRIYPTVVIKDTKLEELFLCGMYAPLSLVDAVYLSKEIYKKFESAGITVLRIGLHPSDGLLNGEEFVAGPFHSSFRELVMTELWNEIFEKFTARAESKIIISVPENQLNYAVGYNGKNKKHLLHYFNEVKFLRDAKLTGREFNVDYY